jgi:hypothetical protein
MSDWLAQHWEWLKHDEAGFFTALLVIVGIFQALLFYVQLKVMRRSLADTKKAAEAATASVAVAHEAIEKAQQHDRILERAYLWPGFGHSDWTAGGRKWFITVHNTGRTAGVIKTVYYALIASEEVLKADAFNYIRYDGREDVIPPPSGGDKEENEIDTGAEVLITEAKICCGWIE